MIKDVKQISYEKNVIIDALCKKSIWVAGYYTIHLVGMNHQGRRIKTN